MKKVIIGIHGLGNKPPKYLLKKWWKDAIKEGFKKHNIKKHLPEFELVYWADILHDKPLDLWEKDKDSPYFLSEPYKKGPLNFKSESHSLMQKLVFFISDQLNKIFLNEDKSMKYEFISEVIIKKYFNDLEIYYADEFKIENGIRFKVRDIIRGRLLDVLTKYKDYDIMIIGHSMGSIIAYDVMDFLIKDIKINTFITIGTPLGFPLMISKIAAEQKLRFNGVSDLATPSCITSEWINMADILDHLALNYKLSDDFNPNKNGISPIDLLVHNDYVINGTKNPHKSYGYLRTPEFSAILTEFIGEDKLNIAQKANDKVKNIIDKVKVTGDIMKDKLNIN